MYKGIAIGVSLFKLVEEEPEEDRDHDGDAGGGVGKKPAGLLDKGHLFLRRDPVPLVNIEHGCQNEVKGEMDNQEKKALVGQVDHPFPRG